MKHLKLLIIIATIFIESVPLYAQKINQWRNIQRQGIYYESGLLEKWPAGGPNLLWTTEIIGQGYAAPVLTENLLLINGEIDTTSYVFAFDKTGKLIWKSANGKEFYGIDFSANYPGARSTPTVVDDLVYAMSGRGRLACFELNSGKEKWNIDLVAQFGGIENYFGYSESPLVAGDTLFCTPGGPIHNMVALNRFTGKTIWTSSAMGDTTAFCSPIIVELPKKKVLVNITRNNIIGLDAATGNLLWNQHLAAFRYDGEHSNTPIYTNGYLYYTTADENGNGTVCLKISDDGKSISEIWRNKDIGNAFGGFVVIKDQLFLTTNDKKLVCMDSKTGQIISTLKPNKGGLIWADNRFYCYNESGDMKLISFENNQFTEQGKFKITKGTKEHFSHPVIRDGILYIRHGKALMAYNIQKK